MKKNKGNNIRLGIFVFTGVILFITGIYFIGKKQRMFGGNFHMSAVFKDISGLQEGDKVRLSGIDIGVIESIEMITDTSVQVDFVIDQKKRKFIHKDAKATIGSDGLMGNKIVIIIPGADNTAEVQNNDFIATLVPVNVDDIVSKLKQTGTNLEDITGNLSVITDNIRAGKGTIGKLFMDTVFAKNIDQTVVSIKQGAGGFKQNMDAASHNILLRGFLKKKEKEEKKDDGNQKKQN